ncbi:MAG: EpsI family protein [Anaerolineales bacterium]|nr:EpsI family protein [Anaerolineales bacterium]
MKRDFLPLAMLALLVLVGSATLFIAYARPTPPPPAPSAPSSAAPTYTYLIDVAGWYEITPNERAIASPFDLSIENLKALPPQIGQWQSDPIKLGNEVNEWFENPDLALSSIYRDARGNQVWFSTFGSRGRKSYFLFEHTPITSYPAAGWTVLESGVTPIPIGEINIFTQRALLTLGGERRVVFYWYLWQNFDRDPEKGILTVRLHVPVTSTDQAAFDVGVDFIRALFPQVVTWRRF